VGFLCGEARFAFLDFSVVLARSWPLAVSGELARLQVLGFSSCVTR